LAPELLSAQALPNLLVTPNGWIVLTLISRAELDLQDQARLIIGATMSEIKAKTCGPLNQAL
jgi:hypothetical protein